MPKSTTFSGETIQAHSDAVYPAGNGNFSPDFIVPYEKAKLPCEVSYGLKNPPR